MEFIGIGIWELLLDMAALTLCGITVMYIVGKKRTATVRPIQDTSEERIQSIVEKNLNHMLHQHPARAFNRVIDAVTKTQPARQGRGVKKVPAVGGSTSQAIGLKNRKRKPVNAPNRMGAMQTRTLDTKPMRVYQFTASGMSVKKISEKLKIPRCEVELIAKFQQHESRQAAVL